jgi:hypothetical protein
MKLPNDPTGKGGAAYFMLVLLLASLPVTWIIQIATGLNIDNRQVECSASPGAHFLVLVAIACLALLIHMAIGY